MSADNTTPAFAASRDAMDLARYRQLAPAINQVLCAELALQGDHADRDLIQLQHAFAALLPPSPEVSARHPSPLPNSETQPSAQP